MMAVVKGGILVGGHESLLDIWWVHWWTKFVFLSEFDGFLVLDYMLF